jgi:hypothetical protein
MLFEEEFNIWSEEELEVADSLVELPIKAVKKQTEKKEKPVAKPSFLPKPDGRGQSTGKYFYELKKIISENKGITLHQARTIYHINKKEKLK